MPCAVGTMGDDAPPSSLLPVLVLANTVGLTVGTARRGEPDWDEVSWGELKFPPRLPADGSATNTSRGYNKLRRAMTDWYATAFFARLFGLSHI